MWWAAVTEMSEIRLVDSRDRTSAHYSTSFWDSHLSEEYKRKLNTWKIYSMSESRWGMRAWQVPRLASVWTFQLQEYRVTVKSQFLFCSRSRIGYHGMAHMYCMFKENLKTFHFTSPDQTKSLNRIQQGRLFLILTANWQLFKVGRMFKHEQAKKIAFILIYLTSYILWLRLNQTPAKPTLLDPWERPLTLNRSIV